MSVNPNIEIKVIILKNKDKNKNMIKITFITMFLSSLLWCDGASLYMKCSECHGSYGEQSALGKSKKIKGQKASRLFNQIQSYARGKQNLYGYGSLMKMQVVFLTEKEMQTLSEYISKMK